MSAFHSKNYTYENVKNSNISHTGAGDIKVNKIALMFLLSLLIPFFVKIVFAFFGIGLILFASVILSVLLSVSILRSSKNFLINFSEVMILIYLLVLFFA